MTAIGNAWTYLRSLIFGGSVEVPPSDGGGDNGGDIIK